MRSTYAYVIQLIEPKALDEFRDMSNMLFENRLSLKGFHIVYNKNLKCYALNTIGNYAVTLGESYINKLIRSHHKSGDIVTKYKI